MKIKRNPIRRTVENYISRRPKHVKPKPKITLKAFFEDLENRGPFHPNSLFRQWTSSIREDMINDGTWIKRSNPGCKARVNFVQEYVSRLQLKFWRMNAEHENWYQQVIACPHDVLLPYWYPNLDSNGIKTFIMIYKAIRVFGLRVKLFCLLKPRTRRHMKYRYLLVESVVTDHAFGKMHTEKAWPYHWARRTPRLTRKMRFCAPLKMSRVYF